MHPECSIPARRVGHLDRRDRGAVMAEVMRAGANPRSVLLDQRSQSHPLQLAHTVRRYEHACAYLAEGRGLLVDRYPQALRDQRIRCEQSANAAADNYNVQSRIRVHTSDVRHLLNRSYSQPCKNPIGSRPGRLLYPWPRCCTVALANTPAKPRRHGEEIKCATRAGAALSPNLCSALLGLPRAALWCRQRPRAIPNVPSKSLSRSPPAGRPMPCQAAPETGFHANGASRWLSKTGPALPEISGPRRFIGRIPTATLCYRRRRHRL